MKKYSVVEKTRRGITYLVAYPEEHGVDTMTGLYQWEMVDSANRQVYFESDKKSANALLKTL